MSILGMFDIGRSALFTTRKALDTTAHNIANASTPGYSRQDVILENVPMGEMTSIGSSGRGVQIKEVKRMYDSFISLQLRTEKSNLSYWDAYDKSATKIENIFNEASDSGIAPAITDFFNAWQEVSQNPESYAQRSLLLKKSEYLAGRINTAYLSVDNERVDLLKSSQSLVNEINAITVTIADMNDKLAAAPGSLDLLDMRDNAVERLNEIMKVTTFEDSNGAVTILLNGTPLVDSGRSCQMSVSADADNYMRVYMEFLGENMDITSAVTGGELKANLDLRDTKIPEIKNKLNEFAFYLSETVNYYHKQGYGLDGSTGNDFFRSLFSIEDLPGGGTLSTLDVTDTTKLDYDKQYKIDYIDTAAYNLLTATEQADYQKEEVGANDLYWRVQESTDGAAWTAVAPSSVTLATNTASGVHYRTFEFNGLDLRIDGYQGALLNNTSEEFIVKANPDAARDMALLITDTQKIAASVDSFSVDTSNNQVVFNMGGANMTVNLPPGLYTSDELAAALESQMQSAVETAYGLSTTDLFSVTYDPNVKQFQITNNSSIKASQGIASQSTAVGGTTFSFQVGSGAVQTIDTTAGGGMTLEDLRDAINATYSGVTANIYNDGTVTNPYRLVLTANSGSAITFPPATNDTNVDLTNKKVEAAYAYTTNTYAGVAASNSGNNYTGTTNKTFLVQAVTAGAPGVAQYKYSTDGGVTWKGSGGATYDGTNGVTVAADDTLQNIDGNIDATTTTEGVKIKFTGGVFTVGATDDTTDRFTIDAFAPDMQPQILWTAAGTTMEGLFGFTADSSFSTGGSDTSDTEVSAQASHGLPGDNKNAKIIADLINQMIISGKTPTDFYRGIVSDAGVDSQSAKRNLTFQFTIVAELESRRQQVSGVSLDEEASNLIMYQKSYEAAAKMISLADELMTTLLGMIAR